MNKKTAFSIKRFIGSSLGYFAIFAGILAMFYMADSQMLEYKFLLISSAIVALVLGVYHGRYKEQVDVNAAIDADVTHVEDEIIEEVEEIAKKLHHNTHT